MPFLSLLFGLILIFAILYFGRAFANADARVLAARLRKIGGVAALFGAGFFLFAGRIAPAIFFATLALALFGRGLPYPLGRPGKTRKSSGQTSSVRTSYLEMILDHDSGSMAGRLLRGRFAGRFLSELSLDQLREVFDELQNADTQGAQLLEAYLDRTFPEWAQDRDRTAANGEARQAGNGRYQSAMSVDEAYRILGLSAGATREDIQSAHRNLMKRFHPDQGGSTYLASKINEAKALLLKQAAR